MRPENVEVFKQEVSKYEKDYFRKDEKYLVKNFFIGNVLVLGCGAGRTLKYLQEHYEEDVIGVDIVPEMVKIAQDRGLPAMEGDARHLPFPNNSFDTVFFPFHGINYNEDVEEVVREAHRVGDTFIFSSYNRFSLGLLSYFWKRTMYHGNLLSTRMSWFDRFWLKKYYKHIIIIPRITIASKRNWKDWIRYILFPFDGTLYFICVK